MQTPFAAFRPPLKGREFVGRTGHAKFSAALRLVSAAGEPAFDEVEAVLAPEHLGADEEHRSTENAAFSRAAGNRFEFVAHVFGIDLGIDQSHEAVTIEADASGNRTEHGPVGDILIALRIRPHHCLRVFCRGPARKVDAGANARRIRTCLALRTGKVRGRDNAAQCVGGLYWKAARAAKRQSREFSVALMVAPQVARLARRHRHHVEAGLAKKRAQMKWYPVDDRIVATTGFRQHESGEVTVRAREIEIEIDDLHPCACPRMSDGKSYGLSGKNIMLSIGLAETR